MDNDQRHADATQYSEAWKEDEAVKAEQTTPAADESMPDAGMDQPATGAVMAAHNADRAADAKEFSDAFNSEAPVAPAKKQSFKEAFAAARAEPGKKQFEWNGKQYSTEMAKAKPKADAKAPDAPRAEGKPAPKGTISKMMADTREADKAITGVRDYSAADKGPDAAILEATRGKSSLAESVMGGAPSFMGSARK